MSTGTPTQSTTPNPAKNSGNAVQVIIGYITPLVAIIGLFVLIALGKLDENVGIPLVAAIVGVHGGAAISGNNTTN